MKLTLLVITTLTTLASSAQIPAYVPQAGLVAWYNFNGNASDESQFSNNGTIFGATPCPDRFGNPNSAFLFSSNDSIVVNHDSSLNFEAGGNFTISYWANIDDFVTFEDQIILSKQSSEGINQDGWNHRVTASLFFYTSIANGNGTVNCTVMDESINTSTGYNTNIVHLYENGELRTYVDNILTSTETCTGIIGDNINNLVIGNASWGSASTIGFKGVLDDIGIWNRALNDCEITDLWNATTATVVDLTLTENGGTLTSNSGSMVSNWVDCDDNYSIIPGASGQSFTPMTSGNYAAAISPFFGCILYSECAYVEVLELKELSTNLFNLYPNPANEKLNIINKTAYNLESIQVLNVIGDNVLSIDLDFNNIDISNLPDGIYYIKIKTSEGVADLKFIKN